MPINPVEDLNTFSEALQDELSKRSRSKELVRTRAPFLRFTTGAKMSDLNKNFPYSGCEFFSLGLHGWDNLEYSAADVYGSKAMNGLLVGVTYKQNEKPKLVYAPAVGVESNKGYPPPGITNVTINRVRAGNVFNIKMEVSCYTLQQLELLDKICFVPGMTCILEWGTVHSTPTGIKRPNNILDFSNPSKVKSDISNSITRPRSEHITNWCLPNNFNYDFAVAKIANIQTTIQDSVYKITVTAVGKADNILYISAYATNTPQNNSKPDKTEVSSINQYFKSNGRFTELLHDIITRPVGDSLAKGIFRFADPDDVKAVQGAMPAAQDVGGINDFGFEDTFFIRFDVFVGYFLNHPINGIISIINGGMKNSETLPRILTNLKDGTDGVIGNPVIYIGFHEDLRSTQPAFMIINNYRKRTAIDRERDSLATQSLKNFESKIPEKNRLDAVGQVRGAKKASGVDDVINKLYNSQFETPNGQASGAVPMGDGIFINSKAIQAAFINARTWAEGLESLLQNINGATEGYWDLKLFFDDEDKSFRILDDNLRKVDGFNKNKSIYTFNKKLVAADNDVIGPDVLDIEVKTDFPKLVFSQIAMSAIGGNVSDPSRKELDFLRGTVVDDIFSPQDEIIPSNQVETTGQSPVSLTISDFVNRLLSADSTYKSFRGPINNALLSYDPTGLPPTTVVQDILFTLFSNKSLLTPDAAANYVTQLKKIQPPLTMQEITVLQQVFAERTKAIITKLKNEEIQRITDAAKLAKALVPIPAIVKITENRDDLIKKITDIVKAPDQRNLVLPF